MLILPRADEFLLESLMYLSSSLTWLKLGEEYLLLALIRPADRLILLICESSLLALLSLVTLNLTLFYSVSGPSSFLPLELSESLLGGSSADLNRDSLVMSVFRLLISLSSYSSTEL